jgi:hypothetical protein
MTRTALLAMAVTMAVSAPAIAQSRTEDEYTRYELLAPETSTFKISYELAAVTPGAKVYFNAIHNATQVSDLSAVDLMTGAALKITEVSGQQARGAGFKDADLAVRYLQVDFARPVPEGGEVRIRIHKTYRDAPTYRRDGDAVVFTRALTVNRDIVVLPANYEILAANVPVQVLEQPDGRIAASLMNTYPGAAPLVLKARAIAARPAAPPPSAATPAAAAPAPSAPADAPPRETPLNQVRVSERAIQDREIVYFLKQPETHAFSLYHDYTASREGERQYVNVVRAGSSVSEPSARILDTGEALTTRTLTGADVLREKIDIPDRVAPDTQLVLIPFAPVKKGQSVRLRISETYTDPARYALVDGQLMWHRSFGRPRNDMVLPAGWYLTTSSIPAVITQEPDGRIRLSFWNPRPDSVDVYVKGRKR